MSLVDRRVVVRRRFDGTNVDDLEELLGDWFDAWLPSRDRILLTDGTTVRVGDMVSLEVLRRPRSIVTTRARGGRL